MAVYGKTTQGASNDNIGAYGRIRANSGVFPENGTLNSISAWVDNVNSTTNRIIGVVYDSSGTLIAVSDFNTTSHPTASVCTLNVAGSISLVAGETYRLGVWGENNNSRVYRDAGASGDGNYLSPATWPTPPNPFSSAGTTSRDFSISLDYTPTTVPTTASRNVTNVAAGAVQTFQVMAAGVNTTPGEGLGGSDLVVIEDNHQVTVPLVVSGVTLTIDPDTLDYTVTKAQLPAGSSITFDAFYYSPSTEKSSKIAVTITAPEGLGSRTITAWIEANGAGGQVNDAWINYMKAEGAAGTTFNDLMYNWLGDLGYTGSLNDRLSAWSKVNLEK